MNLNGQVNGQVISAAKRRSPRAALLKLGLLSTLFFNLATVLLTIPVLASEPNSGEQTTRVNPDAINPDVANPDTVNADSDNSPTQVKVAPATTSPESASTNSSTLIERISEVTSFDPTADQLQTEASSDPMAQVTSVNQLTDVKATDWAFQALQSLVEKYGCIVGYPDKTYRGQRTLSRYEFAAGLNACMDRMSELLASATADLVKKEDLVALQKMQEEFAAELATLRGRVDVVEAKTAQLEADQFSTTTKLSGNVVFALSDVVGADSGRNEAVFQERVNLNFNTSFSGKDLLFISMFAGDVPLFPIGGFRLPATFADGLPINSAEGSLVSSFGANTGNALQLLSLGYIFPVGQRAQVFAIGALTPISALVPTVNPFVGDHYKGTGSLSMFGQHNAIYALGATGAGAGVNFHVSKQLLLSAAYVADGVTASNPGASAGLFNGGYTAFGQLTWTPSPRFTLATTYANTYFSSGRFGFNYNGLPVMGTAVANTLAGQTRLAPGPLFNPPPVIVNSYGVQASFVVNPKFAISGWFGASYATLIGQGDGTIFNYALTFAFPDLGKKGNLLGFVVGAEPYLTRFRGGNPQPFTTDIPFHLEAFYRYQLTNNIAITPGFIVLTAPNQNASNGTDLIGTIRTTFTF